MNSIKIGIIGCGKQAPKHISGLKSVAEAEVQLVVADIDQNLADSLSAQFDVETVSVDSIFQMADLTAIDICTPVSTHFDLAMRALNSGKHVFCEKPLVTDIDQARSLESVRKSNSLVCMVGYIYRYAPILANFKRLIHNKEFMDVFGEPIIANFRIGGRGSHQLWKHLAATGGGAINEMLVHMLDLALWYFGDAVKVSLLSCQQLRSERVIAGVTHSVDAEDSVIIQMEMPSGMIVNIQADMLTPSFTQFVEVQGENGTFCGSIQQSFNSYLFLNEAVCDYDQGLNELDAQPSNLFEAQMGGFVNNILDHNAGGSPSIEDSIKLLEVVDQINNRRYEY